MRYVDLDQLRGRIDLEALIEAANEVSRRVNAEVDPEARIELINANRSRWVAFRQPFESVFGPKCWYTESRNPGTDDDVDHFRPKSAVAECPQHRGYWWEAFNWKNFRLSSHRANRIRGNPDTGETHGKGTHFPLLVESDRWMAPTEQCRELPLLLDPTNPLDPPLLTYGIDGRAALSAEYADDEVAAQRLEASRLYLHLDWPRFVEDRTALYGRIATRVDDGERVVEAALGFRELQAVDTLKSVVRDLLQLVDPRQPYSKAALAYIQVYRDRLWIKRMVLGNLTGDV